MKINHSQGVLLISPPFGSFHAPYISLAVLAGHLQSCAIPVSVFNVSPFLAQSYPTPARIEAGIAALKQSFRELNAQEHLSPSQAAKMTIIYPLLNDIDHFQADRFPPDTALQIAAFPFWPDCLIKRPLLKLASNDSIFSSSELLQAAGKDYFFTDILRAELQRKIAAAKPLLVGIATVFDEQMPAAVHCARLIKEYAPGLHVTMGGPFITAHMDALNSQDFFNFVDTLIFDEGELPLQRLYEELHSGTPDLETVPGIMYRSQQRSLIKNSAAPAPDMETQAFADYPVCNLEQYPLPVEHMRLAVRLSRGCYWQRCTFCRTRLSFCNNFQQPSVDRIFSEIQHIARSTGVKTFLFSDESSHPLVLEQVSRKILASDLRIEWSFHTRIDKKLTKERVTLYKEAGCNGLQVGIETFNNSVLKVLGKGITEELIAEVLENIQGILPVHAYMLVGIPGETEEEANRSYTICQEYKKKDLLQGAYFSLFQLLPGSDMWNNPKKYRINLLRSGPEQDLKPKLCADFVTEEGMTREKAFALFVRYNFPDIARWKQHEQVLTMDGDTILCRYPFQYLHESLHDFLIYQNDLPFQRWLEFIDQRNRPIPPFRNMP